MRFGLPVLVAAESVRHRVTSGVVEGFSTWGEMPALLLAVTAVAVFVIAVYRRDAVDLSRPLRLLLAALRLGALAAVVAAYLDFERTTEREIEFPSRVAVVARMRRRRRARTRSPTRSSPWLAAASTAPGPRASCAGRSRYWRSR